MRCLNDSIYNTSEFQELQKLYPNYSRGFLKDALAFWQDEYRKGQDIIPLEKADKGSFTRFLNTRAQTLYHRPNTSASQQEVCIPATSRSRRNHRRRPQQLNLYMYFPPHP